MNTGRFKVLAGQKLKRWGFNPDRRCALPSICRDLLVKTPGHEDELFPAIDYRDKLHGMLTFFFRTLSESFCHMGLSQAVQTLLDRRLTELGTQRIMRDPNSGRSFRVQKSLFKEAGMTGEDKVQWLFLLPHVLGHQALCLPEEYRDPILTAISTVQIMVMAARGLRCYSIPELRLIYDRGYVLFFSAMERVYHLGHDAKYAKRLRKHLQNPQVNVKPKQFCRQKRLIINHHTHTIHWDICTLCTSTHTQYIRTYVRRAPAHSHKYTRTYVLCALAHTHNTPGHMYYMHQHTRATHQDICNLCTHTSTCVNSKWSKHTQDDSDTVDTDENEDVGGLGKYSHGVVGLSHQHWVEQVISAGSFGVHCTEAAEAAHKTSMGLSARRVRHSRQNITQKSMLKYLCRHTLFETMLRHLPPSTRPINTRTKCTGFHIKLPLKMSSSQGPEYAVSKGTSSLRSKFTCSDANNVCPISFGRLS